MSAALATTPVRLWAARDAGVSMTRVDLAIGGRDALYYLPVNLAEALGFFAAAGLEVRIWNHPGGAAALDAVRAGDADVAAGPFDGLVLEHLRGAGDLQSFCVFGRTPQLVLGASTRTMPPRPLMRDLRGRIVGVTSLGSTSHRLLRLLLLRGGVPEAAVRMVAAGSAEALAQGLRAGALDAICGLDPWITALEQSGDIRILFDTRLPQAADVVFEGAMPGGCLYAPAAQLRAQVSWIEPMVWAVVRALKWLRSAEISDWAELSRRAPGLRDAALMAAAVARAVGGYTVDGDMPTGGGATTLKNLARLYPSLSLPANARTALYTDRYLLRARARMRGG